MSDRSNNSDSRSGKSPHQLDYRVDSAKRPVFQPSSLFILPSSANGRFTDTPKAEQGPGQNSTDSNVSASTPFMPQSGKVAGMVNHPPHHDQRVDGEPDKDRREDDVAGSSRWIPQAGKPTGNSSL